MSLAVPSQKIEELAKLTTPEAFKAHVLKAVGDLGEVDIMFNMVLLAIYIRPEKTVGNIIRPFSNVQEDVWQGKAGLVIKLGPDAFKSDGEYNFEGQKLNRGDWCVFKVSDAWSVNIAGIPCRLVKDDAIRMKVKNPQIVF